jgi:hypothetical protein
VKESAFAKIYAWLREAMRNKPVNPLVLRITGRKSRKGNIIRQGFFSFERIGLECKVRCMIGLSAIRARGIALT